MHFELKIDHLLVAPRQLESAVEQLLQCFLVCSNGENISQYQHEEKERDRLLLLHCRIAGNVCDWALDHVVYHLAVEQYIFEVQKHRQHSIHFNQT